MVEREKPRLFGWGSNIPPEFQLVKVGGVYRYADRQQVDEGKQPD